MERLTKEKDPKVLATLCLGISKLALAGIARDINVMLVLHLDLERLVANALFQGNSTADVYLSLT